MRFIKIILDFVLISIAIFAFVYGFNKLKEESKVAERYDERVKQGGFEYDIHDVEDHKLEDNNLVRITNGIWNHSTLVKGITGQGSGPRVEPTPTPEEQ